MMPEKTVLIFREKLLPISETFIVAQASALTGYRPVYAGLRRTEPRLHIQPEILLSKSDGWRAAAGARLFGKLPGHSRYMNELAKAAPALIHAHFAFDGTVALPILRRLNVPLIVTLHGGDVTATDETIAASMRGRQYLSRREELWEAASRFLCVSEAIRRRALAVGFPEDKLRIHYTGIDCEKFKPLEASERDAELVVFVGRLVEKKGCEYAIRAMSELRSEGRTARLVVIGDGPLRGSLEALAERLGIQCQFLGAQNAERVRDYVGRARALLNPSVIAQNGDSEGFGMVFAEAQAMGTPVASFRHGGIPEAVCDGKTGLLAPERDVLTLAAHLHRFLTDDAFWQSCSDRATSWVRERFDLHKQTPDLENIYEEVVMEAKHGVCLRRSERPHCCES
jgi:glycosyltransferase involved in cell wall biosynthesis